MFMRLLSDDQKKTLWVLAHHLVVADHSVSIKEGDLLDELKARLRTDIPVSPQELMEKPDLDALNNREARVAVMLEILTLAYGDNMLPDAESKMVAKIGTDLGFTKSEYDQMKAWSEKNCALLDEAVAMMAE